MSHSDEPGRFLHIVAWLFCAGLLAAFAWRHFNAGPHIPTSRSCGEQALPWISAACQQRKR